MTAVENGSYIGMTDQLILKFPKKNLYSKEDFYVSPSNVKAYDFVTSWPKWIKKIVNIFLCRSWNSEISVIKTYERDNFNPYIIIFKIEGKVSYTGIEKSTIYETGGIKYEKGIKTILNPEKDKNAIEDIKKIITPRKDLKLNDLG